MTDDEIDALSKDAIADLMRSEGLQVIHSMFATVHFRSEQRPDGFTDDDLDGISEGLEDGDLKRWKQELKDRFRQKDIAS